MAINATATESYGYWVTRRLALNMIAQVSHFIDAVSPIAGKTPAAYRDELVALEREVALAATEKSVSTTPVKLLQKASGHAELLQELNITQVGKTFRLTLRGRQGGEAAGQWSRAELQRITHMLEQEVMRAEWGGPHEPKPELEPEAKRARRLVH